MMKKLAFVLPILMFAEASSLAAPPVVANPQRPPVQPSEGPSVRKFVKLEAKNTFANPGDTKELEATLTLGQTSNGVAGKQISFRITGNKDNKAFVIVVGSGVTNAQGKATASWKVTELPQGPYKVSASFAGDNDYMSAQDEASFGVFKGITEFELSDLSWFGSYGTVWIAIKRKNDKRSLDLSDPARKIAIYVNDALSYVGGSSSYGYSVAFPLSNGTSWKIKVVWMGDDTYMGASAERNYQKP